MASRGDIEELIKVAAVYVNRRVLQDELESAAKVWNNQFFGTPKAKLSHAVERWIAGLPSGRSSTLPLPQELWAVMKAQGPDRATKTPSAPADKRVMSADFVAALDLFHQRIVLLTGARRARIDGQGQIINFDQSDRRGSRPRYEHAHWQPGVDCDCPRCVLSREVKAKIAEGAAELPDPPAVTRRCMCDGSGWIDTSLDWTRSMYFDSAVRTVEACPRCRPEQA